ncbi:sigma-70 family RNA polymerase sigma factor [Actinomadura viridis]|uniref:RNA polymerase sigma-70 factor (ECF subfamily) n=1 Tax=Actinomadura viridis TaxID=58110 RepID=A0A931GMA7_9ACTN|nr:sigma-70 family RNA polymerase sigma factor [Actinomadura viridis]MBG6092432.1 RNA polymerase sigma-70 factor (ECF subfamily) [Actinomadura viridis]
MTDPDDIARFTALYDAHYGRVYAYAVSRAGRQIAEEIASETFCVAWRRMRDLPDVPVPWLLGIARNLLRESNRANSRQDALAAELRSVAQRKAPTADIGETVVERAEVLQALAALSDADRELLTLVAWHGLSSGAAAKVIGCSRATFFVRLHRARRRLENALAAPGMAEPPASGPQPPATSTFTLVREEAS